MNTAMILAAGRGERLKPLTNSRPKALCLINGIPLIEYHVANLAKAGFKRLIINHAYLGGQIRKQLGNGSRWQVEICYAPEPPGGLETGGGILNALPLLGNEPFLTVNADILTNYNFSQLQLPPDSMIHLVLVNKPAYIPQPDFGLMANQQLDNLNRKFTFAGITCYHPDSFDNLKPGRFSVVPLLRELAEKKLATGEVYQGEWIDIGSPVQLQLARV